ncbi:MAG TPA: BatA domain-containing protein [Solirubrobacteraceae bacterium]|nr:BatA domain-containing protein [Solirubrobacteraceae bacterium]
MTLLSGWALAGLVLLVPLVIAHLRRRQSSVYDVPSLLLWDGLDQQPSAQSRRLRLPRLPLLLVLQALALVLLVVGLARPASTAAAPTGAHIYVLDDSLWMGVDGRLASAELRTEQLVGMLPRRAQVWVVLADGAPRVLYHGPPAGVASSLHGVAASAAPSMLADAMSVAAGVIASPHDRVVLLRAPEDGVPSLRTAPGQLRTFVTGARVADQGILSPSARCGIDTRPLAGGCEVLAVVANSGTAPASDRYVVSANGRVVRSGRVRVGARSTTTIVLAARPAEQLRLRLDLRDALAADDQAWVSVPGPSGAPPSTVVTLVGAPSDALAVARAFAAVPGVTLRLRTPTSYRAADARDSELTVLDGSLPHGTLPPSPSVLLIDPPRVPGGHVGGALPDSTLSGTDAGSDLLSGVDLTSLAVNSDAARSLALPGYLMPVVWSPDGPLLAAGDDGSRRVAVLSFDPAQSDLPQLASFPVLASNLVRYAAGWAPASAPAGVPLRIDATPGARELTLSLDGVVVGRDRLRGTVVELPVTRPGLYTVEETGPGVDHRATVAVSVAAQAIAGAAPAAGAPIDLTATRAAPPPGHGPLRAPWLLGAAIVVLVLEWAYWRSRAPRLKTATG